MRPLVLILWFILAGMILCFTSCSRKKRVYDPEPLRKFVLTTSKLSEERSVAQLDSVLREVHEDSALFRQTAGYLEKSFANSNSAYRHETLAIKLYQAMANSSFYSKEEQAALTRKLRLTQQNRPGSRANNFMYFTVAGEPHQLYDLTTPYTLLFFYNPDCPACKQYAYRLFNSAVLNVKLSSGELTVLAVYTDPDLEPWKKSLPDYPKDWTLAHDDNEYLYKNDIYDVRAIPAIYLLDNNKTVLLKDCLDIELIERYLLNLD